MFFKQFESALCVVEGKNDDVVERGGGGAVGDGNPIGSIRIPPDGGVRDLADFGVEVGRAADLLRRQAAVSRLPGGRVLAEVTETREGSHLFLFPFGGQLANEGLAALLGLTASFRIDLPMAPCVVPAAAVCALPGWLVAGSRS